MISPVVLAGIAAGALVFVGSLVAVYLLLRYGGSFDRMAREAAGLPATLGEQKPLLYDELLATARALPPRPAPLPGGKALAGRVVSVRDFQDEDVPLLFAISNGQPRCVARGGSRGFSSPSQPTACPRTPGPGSTATWRSTQTR